MQVPQPIHLAGSITGCSDAGSVNPASIASALACKLRACSPLRERKWKNKLAANGAA
jgi:hypothetical protein